MAKILIPVLLFIATSSFGQNVIGTVNTGAVSASNLVYTVGEIFVQPSTPSEANSGLIGVLSRIAFLQTGIRHHKPAVYMSVFPNPTQGRLYFRNTTDNLFRQVFVYDINGQLVSQYSTAPGFIDLSGCANGIYSILTDNVTIHPLKIVKQ